MFNRIQIIKEVNGDQNLIINGDVVVEEDVLEKVAEHLLKTELEQLTLEARQKMDIAVEDCVKTIMKRMVDKNLKSKLIEFSNPSTQYAFYSTLKGFTISETVEQRELLVDTLIERIESNWDSTEKMILDSVLEILPKLSPQTLSTIGLLQLRHQLVNASIGFMLNDFFKSLTPLAERMAQITSLDLEYLKQERLILPLPDLKFAASLGKILLSNYDLFFRHSLPEGVYDDYCKKHPEAHESVDLSGACMMWIDGTKNNATSFCCCNTQLLKSQLRERQQDYIIPHVDALKLMMPPYTEKEVRDFFINLSPTWGRLFDLFSSENFTKYVLSITGNYIGGKVISKATHGQPLSLADYKKISLL